MTGVQTCALPIYGHLFQIHALGRTLYDNQKSGRVTDMEWGKGFEQALFYLGSAVYEGVAEGISENEIKIVKGIKLFESNKIGDINRRVRIKGINVYLRRLTDKGILKTFSRGEYVIHDKMLGEYLQRK